MLLQIEIGEYIGSNSLCISYEIDQRLNLWKQLRIVDVQVPRYNFKEKRQFKQTH